MLLGMIVAASLPAIYEHASVDGCKRELLVGGWELIAGKIIISCPGYPGNGAASMGC